MNDDVLEYAELMYSYAGTFDPLDNQDLMYNYFTFIEGKEAVYINSLNDYFTLNYTSIETNSHFDISYGVTELGQEVPSLGYTINFYDSEAMAQTFLSVVDDQIISESYDIFNEHGSVYSYIDHPVYGEDIILIVNIIEAIGWDHIVVCNNNGGGAGDLDGIYDTNDQALYSGRIRLTYSPTYAYAAIDQYVKHGELSDDDFNLSSFGLDLDVPQATLAYFNQIRITDFNEVKQTFILDDLNFFADDLEEELYNYLDDDIQASIEGTNDLSRVITGDGVEEFTALMDAFYSDYASNPQIKQLEVGTISSYDTRTESTVENDVILNLSVNQNETFLNMSIFGSSYSSYTIMEKDDRLFAFEDKGMTVDYYSINDIASVANFTKLINANTNFADPMTGIESVNIVENHVYSVVMNSGALGMLGDYFIDDYNLYGLHDALITAIFYFDSDDTYYTYEIEITGLLDYSFYYNPKEISYYGEGIVSLETVLVIEPITEDDILYLPTDKDDILRYSQFESTTRYRLHTGTNYASIYLEAGGTRIRTSSGYGVDVSVLDSSGTLLSDNEIFTIPEAGYYYIAIHSVLDQEVELYIYPYDLPEFDESILSLDSGTYSVTIEAENIYYIYILENEDNRLLHVFLDATKISLGQEQIFMLFADPFEANSNEMCMLTDQDESFDCYFDIKSGIEYKLEISTDILGDVSFNYDFTVLDPEASSNYQAIDLNDIPRVFLGEGINQARIDFSITEERSYHIQMNYIQFDSIIFRDYLYQSNGTLIDDEFWDFDVLLPVGDYYILVDILESPDITAIVEIIID